jgi:hypothetical protein
MPKTPDERIEALEKKVKLYRILVTLMIVLICITQRNRLVSWMDSAESWINGVQQVRA